MRTSVKWLFAVSLLLNMLLAGYVLGKAADKPESYHRHHGMDFSGLPLEKQKLLESDWASFRADNADRFKKIRRLREDIVTIIEAPEFNEAAFRAKSKELDALFAQGKTQMIDLIARAGGQLNQQERIMLARRMHRPPPGPMGPPEDNKD